MRPKDAILRWVREKGEIKSSDLVKALKISRQTAAQHLRELAAQKKLIRLGTTIDSRYIACSPAKARLFFKERKMRIRRPIPGLSEDALFREVTVARNLKKEMSAMAYRIGNYAFTEMLNNAIEHSGARSVDVEVNLIHGTFSFLVEDRGIGAFESVRKRFRLNNHYEALEHLMKGKQTTAPKGHTGQGIFFTSKIADRFSLESGRLRWIVNNQKQDQFVEEMKKPVKGTSVSFVIKQKSKKDLKALFDAYSNEQFEFDKSSVAVRLLHKEGDPVSRSEARRLLFGLEKFKRVVFDFKKVDAVGQAFADEIFRVFRQKNPKILLEPVHMNPAVEFMVTRALRDTLQ